jgi:hypothetical protein
LITNLKTLQIPAGWQASNRFDRTVHDRYAPRFRKSSAFAPLLIALTLFCCGCGQGAAPAAVGSEPPSAESAPEVDPKPGAQITQPLTDAELLYCASVGRIQVEESLKQTNPQFNGTASILAGGAQVVLLPEANEFAATHLMIRQVQFTLPSGGTLIQMWGIYCLNGEPVGAKHLFLGQRTGD